MQRHRTVASRNPRQVHILRVISTTPPNKLFDKMPERLLCAEGTSAVLRTISGLHSYQANRSGWSAAAATIIQYTSRDNTIGRNAENATPLKYIVSKNTIGLILTVSILPQDKHRNYAYLVFMENNRNTLSLYRSEPYASKFKQIIAKEKKNTSIPFEGQSFLNTTVCRVNIN